ncbi:hypothetical protein AAII07_20820 [Microvirga sp. 0TCS3.31]
MSAAATWGAAVRQPVHPHPEPEIAINGAGRAALHALASGGLPIR